MNFVVTSNAELVARRQAIQRKLRAAWANLRAVQAEQDQIDAEIIARFAGDADQCRTPTTALSKNCLAVLHALEGAPRLLVQEEVSAAAEISRNTAGDLLRVLEARGLVERPSGQRSGWAITPSGRAARIGH